MPVSNLRIALIGAVLGLSVLPLAVHANATSGTNFAVTSAPLATFADETNEVQPFASVSQTPTVSTFGTDKAVNALVQAPYAPPTPVPLATTSPVAPVFTRNVATTPAITDTALAASAAAAPTYVIAQETARPGVAVVTADALAIPVATAVTPVTATSIAAPVAPAALVTINAIPEPESIALLGVGLIGLGIVRRRRA